jgi:pimeloyl-ACP methyl ester carboxylesterase
VLESSRQPVLLALVVTALPLAGCGGDDAPAEQKPSLVWTECGGALECATFEVPFDHDAPDDGRKFQIPLVRLPAADPSARIGSLLVNPGGPGGSGVNWVKVAWVVMPQAIKNRFDLVGFDPRGQAASTPAIDCVDDLGPFLAVDTSPEDAAEREALLAEADALAAGCAERSAELLPFVGTDSVIRDMDALRAALGDDKLSFMGFSYGTFLGTMYAEAYPERVRALLLDAPLDPKLAGEEFIAGQALGFEEQLGEFLADCAADKACPFLSGGDPAAAYDALQAEIEAAPIAAGARTLGPGEFAYGVSAALYRPSGWKQLASALALAAGGDGSELLEFADEYAGRRNDGIYGNVLEVYYGVTSIDASFAEDPAVYEALTAEMALKAPRLGVYLPYSALPSARWPVEPWRTPGPVLAEGAPPILVVTSTRDPATPHAWGVSLAEQLSSGVLLTREGNGHVSFLRGNTCIDQAVTDYLVDLKVPADGTVCP